MVFVCVVLHSKSMLPGPMLTSLGWRPRGGVGGWDIGREEGGARSWELLLLVLPEEHWWLGEGRQPTFLFS